MRSRFDGIAGRGYLRSVRRLGLVRIRICTRCGRGGAEFRTDDNASLVVRLDPARAAQLRGPRATEEMRWLTDVVLGQLAAAGFAVRELVIDVVDGTQRAFLTLAGPDDTEPEVVACTPEEAVAVALRGGHRLFATDEALAAPRGRGEPRDEGGAGGPGTLH